MTNRTAYEIMEADEQRRSDRPAYPYQPVKGTLGLDCGDLNSYDWAPVGGKRPVLPHEQRRSASAPTTTPERP
jgi:hypothetical protein